MKRIIPFIICMIIISLSLTNCEKEICKNCYYLDYALGTDSLIGGNDTMKMCAGDYIAWESFGNEDIDSLGVTRKYRCDDLE